jgi:hypothetical protein
MGILNFNIGASINYFENDVGQFAGWKIVLTGLFVDSRSRIHKKPNFI